MVPWLSKVHTFVSGRKPPGFGSPRTTGITDRKSTATDKEIYERPDAENAADRVDGAHVGGPEPPVEEHDLGGRARAEGRQGRRYRSSLAGDGEDGCGRRCLPPRALVGQPHAVGAWSPEAASGLFSGALHSLEDLLRGVEAFCGCVSDLVD